MGSPPCACCCTTRPRPCCGRCGFGIAPNRRRVTDTDRKESPSWQRSRLRARPLQSSTPPASLRRARAVWSGFSGSTTGLPTGCVLDALPPPQRIPARSDESPNLPSNIPSTALYEANRDCMRELRRGDRLDGHTSFLDPHEDGIGRLRWPLPTREGLPQATHDDFRPSRGGRTLATAGFTIPPPA